jgi:hypothetical protein
VKVALGGTRQAETEGIAMTREKAFRLANMMKRLIGLFRGRDSDKMSTVRTHIEAIDMRKGWKGTRTWAQGATREVNVKQGWELH